VATERERAKRLLLVDDEDSIVVPMSRYFRRLGCEVATAGTPDEARARLRGDAFDLLILDLELKPFDRGGLDVLAFSSAAWPDVPVIILSAHVSPEAEAEAEALARDALVILRKPQLLADVAQAALVLMETHPAFRTAVAVSGR
jgi:two-component system, OmpR family, alkaline phosphatase synthesis response regulator PhoP